MGAKGVKIKWGKYFHVYNISLFASLMPSCEDSEIGLCSDDGGGGLFYEPYSCFQIPCIEPVEKRECMLF